MKEINHNKYELDSLKLIHQEAYSHLSDIWLSFRETTNRSYIAIAVYGSVAVKLMTDYNLTIMLKSIVSVMVLLPIVLLIKNILPTNMNFKGVEPSRLIDDYFENSKKEEQIKIYYSFLIEMIEEQIKNNSKKSIQRAIRLKYSIYAELILLLFVLFLWFCRCLS